MSFLKSWVFSVCVAAVVICVISMLTPNGKTEKIMRFIIGLFFILLIGAPAVSFVSKLKDIDYDKTASGWNLNSDADIAEDGYNEQIKRLLIKKIEKKLSDGLLSAGADLNFLSADININKDNCIEISEVKVYLYSKPSKIKISRIEKYIKANAGVIPIISVKSGEG